MSLGGFSGTIQTQTFYAITGIRLNTLVICLFFFCQLFLAKLVSYDPYFKTRTNKKSKQDICNTLSLVLLGN